MAFGRKKRRTGGIERAPKEWERGQPIQKTNAAFVEYYKLQKVCADAEELEAMITAYQTDLPAAFRVNSNVDLRESVLEAYTSRVDSNLEIEGPTCLDWYPNKLGFSWEALARQAIRRDPNYLEVKEDLVNDAERGAIARQEIVSMIPPLLMEMNQHSACLDLCAAPGSKTSELLDMATQDATKNFEIDILNLPLLPKAFVVSNDVNLQRARLLSHQLAKLGHPGSAVICADATMFPKCDDPDLLFDRVLADVPCSGDGTLRKNVDIWLKWSVKGGMHLHDRQLQILQRGLELVAPGGRLVYSTCSLNPIEDEAVVAAALKANANRFRLLPADPLLGTLVRSPGHKDWLVPNPAYFENFDDSVPVSLEPSESALQPKLVKETMFASHYDNDTLEQLPLTSRFLPHHNNSGGFFVAVFECSASSEPSLRKKRSDPSSHKPNNETRSEVFNIELVPPSDADVSSILDFYGLTQKAQATDLQQGLLVPGSESRVSEPESPAFDPRTALRDLVEDFPKTFPLIRKEGADRRLYLVCPRLIDYAQTTKSLPFISLGTKAFERLNEKFGAASGCAFRIAHEAIPWLLPYMRRRVVFGTYKVGARLILDDINREELMEFEREGSVQNLDSCRKRGSDGVNLIECGSCVFVACNAFEERIVPNGRRLGCLRLPAIITGAGNISPLVRKQTREALLRKISHESKPAIIPAPADENY